MQEIMSRTIKLASIHPSHHFLTHPDQLLTTSPCPRRPKQLLKLLQNLRQKVLKAQRNIPIPIIIILLEHIRHPLEANTRLHEQIEAHDALVPLVVRPEQQVDEPVAEAVPKRHERVAELVEADVAAVVGVEAVEEGAPRGQEGPEPAELVEADGPAAVRVEHAYHHAQRVGVERGPVAVYQGGREFLLRELACACFSTLVSVRS
jgi:hypothetical protein